MEKKKEGQQNDDEEPEDDDLEIVLDDPRTRGAAGADAAASGAGGANGAGGGDDSDDDFDVQLDEAAVASAVPVPAARAEGGEAGGGAGGGGGGAASAAPAAPPKPRGPRMPSYPGELVGERESWRELEIEREGKGKLERGALGRFCAAHAPRSFYREAPGVKPGASRSCAFSRRPLTFQPAPTRLRERALSFCGGWRVWDGAEGTGTEVERSPREEAKASHALARALCSLRNARTTCCAPKIRARRIDSSPTLFDFRERAESNGARMLT